MSFSENVRFLFALRTLCLLLVMFLTTVALPWSCLDLFLVSGLCCENFDESYVQLCHVNSVHPLISCQAVSMRNGAGLWRAANAIMFNICINNLQLLDYTSSFFPYPLVEGQCIPQPISNGP